MSTQPTVRFAVIGLNHGHIYNQTRQLLDAGAELVSVYTPEPELLADYMKEFPQAQLARAEAEILEDESIQLIAAAGIPNERAPLGIRVMQHGKDYMVDKPGLTSIEQLADARRVQAETGRIYSVVYSERFERPSTVKAGELVRAGAIGQVVQTVGMSPHRIDEPNRPEWFFCREKYGGILVDIGSHQIDQFLFMTNSSQVEVAFSQVANYKYPQYPELEDFGEMVLRGDGGTGYIRVDWFTPDGLDTWGDVRLTILGTEGYIELRKYCDLAGRPGGDHLFLVTQESTQYIDCKDMEIPYGPQLLNDVINRTETAMAQDYCFQVCELTLQAQAQAQRLGHLAHD